MPVRGRAVGEEEWVEYESASAAARALKLHQGAVSACCNGKIKSKQTGGYEFEFGDPVEPAEYPGEVWKPYGTAEVSSLGRLRRLEGRGRKMNAHTPHPRKDGYVIVTIDGKRIGIHRAIAIAFELERSEGQDEVDHIDGNRSNNKLENLRWATRSENIRHSFATNTNQRSSAEKTSKPVRGRRVDEEEEWVV